MKLISDYFDLAVDTFDEGYLDLKRRYHLIRRRDVIIEELERLGCAPGDGLWLDAGCGAGVLTFEIAARNFYTLGVDLSKSMIERCRENAGRFNLESNTAFQIGDVESLPYTDGSLAGIICSGVIEYLEEPEIILAEFARVLRPGAPVIITFNNALSPYRWASGPLKRFLQRLIRGKTSLPKNRAYALGRARRMFSAAGISVVGYRFHTFACRVRQSWFPPLIIARRLEILSHIPVVRGLGWGLVIVGRRTNSVHH